MNLSAPAVTQNFAIASTIPPPRTHCTCGHPLDEAEWARMPLRGFQDDGDGGWLALLNCLACGTTLAREVVGIPQASRLPGDREACGFQTRAR